MSALGELGALETAELTKRGRSLLQYVGPIFLILLLLLTNRYLFIASDSQILPGDSFSYLRIARAFPGLPVSNSDIPAHHAQRFVIPYIVGGFSQLTHLPLEASFRIFAICGMLLVVTLFGRILYNLPDVLSLHSLWIFALLILNPYSFRIYIAAPYLLNDLFFQAGLTALLLGLFKESTGLSLLGASLAICSRQTGLLLVPPTLLWLILLWPRNKKTTAMFTGALAILIVSIVYSVTSYVALQISGGWVSVAHVTGLLTWMRGSPSVKALMEFGLRGVIGLTLPIATVLGTFPGFSSLTGWPREDRLRTACLLGFAVVIAAQPILGGPAVTGHDITRLVLLGLPAILLALAVVLPHMTLSYGFWQQALPFCMVTVAAGSFHHTYSFLGISNGADRTVQFALVHFGCGILLLFALKVLAVKEHRQRNESYYSFLDGSLRQEFKNASSTNSLGTSKGKTCL
jgi:hypothetical protein